MKKINLNKIAVLLVSLVVLTGCVEDDNFDVPSTIEGISEYPNTDAEFNTLSGVLGAFGSNGNEAYTYEAASETVSEKYTVGYVVSSDEGGNFYKQLVIQDAPENPTAAIVVQVDKNPLFTQYEFGRKVYVKLNGLTVGESNGVLQLGRLNGDQIDEIASTLVPNHIIRTSEVATIVPKEVTISQFSDELESQYIRLNNMQFERDIVMGDNPLTFASETTDSFDGERLLESCATGGSVILSTSTFSDFKGLPLPATSGSIDCILTRDYFDDFYTVYVNTPEAINFDSTERCDPFDINDFDIIYQEDFTDGFVGWEVTNTVGTRQWSANDFGGEFYARGSAFSGGSIVQMVSWLISPTIDFDAQEDEQLVLEIADAFFNGEALKAYYSNDYVIGSDPSTATWIEIGTQEIEALPDNTGFFNNEYDQTDLIDLSGVSGNAVLAFVYDSNNATVSSTVDLSDVKILTPQ